MNTGSYIFLLDLVSFGILMTAIAAFLWREYPKGYIWGIPFIVAALGLYQSNISVTITLLMLISILDLLDGVETKTVLIKGFLGVGMVVAGGVAYAICNKIV